MCGETQLVGQPNPFPPRSGLPKPGEAFLQTLQDSSHTSSNGRQPLGPLASILRLERLPPARSTVLTEKVLQKVLGGSRSWLGFVWAQISAPWYSEGQGRAGQARLCVGKFFVLWIYHVERDVVRGRMERPL